MRNIAVFSPIRPSYSETFINAHLQRLPYKTWLFYSLPQMGYHPIYDGENRPLSSDLKWVNYLETGIDRLFGESGTGYFFRRRSMLQFFQKHRIEAALAEYGPTATYLLPALKQAKLPLIIHFHGRDAYHYGTLQRFGARYKKAFDYASAIIAVSDDMRRQLLQLGAPEHKLILNPYGPNTELFHLPSEYHLRPPVFLAVGRFTGKKAPFTTIRAFHRVWQQHPEARLIMVADGPLWEASKALVRELGMEHAVMFTGPQPAERIAEWHMAAMAFVQHSVRDVDGDSEGTPVAILEAMASGLPVVATRHAGIKDVVLEGETGLLVDEGDEAGMATQMIQLVENPTLARQMGLAGAQRIQDHYTMERHIGVLAEVIAACLKP